MRILKSLTKGTGVHSAIRLAASTSSELSNMIRDATEQESRRRGWVCIFPTTETWNTYGVLLEYGSSNNMILHEHLFPGMIRKPANKIRPRFKDNKKRSKSAGQSTFEKKLATTESFENKFNLSEIQRALSPGELRVAQYEKQLEKVHKITIKTKICKDLDKHGKQIARSVTLREKLIQMIESAFLHSSEIVRFQ